MISPLKKPNQFKKPPNRKRGARKNRTNGKLKRNLLTMIARMMKNSKKLAIQKLLDSQRPKLLLIWLVSVRKITQHSMSWRLNQSHQQTIFLTFSVAAHHNSQQYNKISSVFSALQPRQRKINLASKLNQRLKSNSVSISSLKLTQNNLTLPNLPLPANSNLSKSRSRNNNNNNFSLTSIKCQNPTKINNLSISVPSQLASHISCPTNHRN